MSWVHRAEARENGLGFKSQGNCIMKTCTWDEGAAFGERGAAG